MPGPQLHPQLAEAGQRGTYPGGGGTLHQTNSLPEVCGRVCPQDRLCEGACTLNDRFGAVTIGNIEKYITDKAFEMGWKPDLSKWSRPASGSPSSAPARRASPVPTCWHGAVSPRWCSTSIRRSAVCSPLASLLQAGKRGDAASPRDLRGDGGGVSPRDRGGPRCHLRRPARRVRCGLPRGRHLQVHEGGFANEEAPGVYDALPYLIANANRLLGFEKAQADYIDFAGKQVVVLGGGDTAMDCVRTAIRQGADKVICAYRRDEENMPGSKREVKNAREEGVEFMFNLQPVGVELDAQGRTCGIKVVSTELGAPDANGRRNPVVVTGSEQVLTADAVVMAFGFQPNPQPGWRNTASSLTAGIASGPRSRPTCLPDQQPQGVRRWRRSARLRSGGDRHLRGTQGGRRDHGLSGRVICRRNQAIMQTARSCGAVFLYRSRSGSTG